jgi:nuclear autoantigenic sperm protein
VFSAIDHPEMSSVDPAKAAIPEEPTAVEGLSPAEGENQRDSVPPVENSTASAAEPGTPDCPEAGSGAGEGNEAKDDGDIAAGASPVEGLLMNGSAVGNGDAAAAEQDPLPSPKTLEDAEALFQKGCDALKADDLVEAVDSLSRALEIRVAHFGELAPECTTTYYKYGCALLYKAQDEADPFNESAALAKKAESSSKNATEVISGKVGKGEPSEPLVTEVPIKNDKGKGSVSDQDGVESVDEGTMDKEEGAEGEESDEEDAGEDVDVEGEDEEDSDLDLAWKMLESARVILDKQEDTIEKVDVISALGDVSLEREDFQTSLSDYLRALSILERLEEPNSRHISQLCFKICLALQMQNKIPDALNYCQRALSICASRMQRLTNEAETSKGESSGKDAQTNNVSEGDLHNGTLAISATEDEVNVLKGLMSDLSDKIEDLKAMMSAPPLFEVLQSLYDDKSVSQDKNACTSGNSFHEVASTESNGFDQPSLPAVPSGGNVTHLGVVGRGVKRATPVPIDVAEPSTKKILIGSTSSE